MEDVFLAPPKMPTPKIRPGWPTHKIMILNSLLQHQLLCWPIDLEVSLQQIVLGSR